jgi:hypothetical protein
MSTDSAGVHGHRCVGEPAWRNPAANQAFDGFNPHTKVVSATEQIWSQKGFSIPSSAAFGKIGDAYVAEVYRWAKKNEIPVRRIA